MGSELSWPSTRGLCSPGRGTGRARRGLGVGTGSIAQRVSGTTSGARVILGRELNSPKSARGGEHFHCLLGWDNSAGMSPGRTEHMDSVCDI